MNYNEIVEQYFFHSAHVGTLDLRQANTVMCQTGDKARGAYFDLYLACQSDGLIMDARFQAYGNPYLIAGLGWLCAGLPGTSIAMHPRFNYHDIVQQLAIPAAQYPVAVLIGQGYVAVLKKMNERLQGKHDER